MLFRPTWRPTLALAGALTAGAVGLLSWGVAWATSPSGLTTTILSGPVTLEEVKVRTRTDQHSVKFQTKETSDVYVVQNRITPGGHTGWHSHPGPSIVSVVSGQATEYHAEDPANGIVHAAGTAFVDDGDGAHLVKNEGTVDLVLIAFQVIPQGAVRRVDEDQP
jgi:quercetin dioxygenase-like cupin family protein